MSISMSDRYESRGMGEGDMEGRVIKHLSTITALPQMYPVVNVARAEVLYAC